MRLCNFLAGSECPSKSGRSPALSLVRRRAVAVRAAWPTLKRWPEAPKALAQGIDQAQ